MCKNTLFSHHRTVDLFVNVWSTSQHARCIINYFIIITIIKHMGHNDIGITPPRRHTFLHGIAVAYLDQSSRGGIPPINV